MDGYGAKYSHRVLEWVPDMFDKLENWQCLLYFSDELYARHRVSSLHLRGYAIARMIAWSVHKIGVATNWDCNEFVSQTPHLGIYPTFWNCCSIDCSSVLKMEKSCLLLLLLLHTAPYIHSLLLLGSLARSQFVRGELKFHFMDIISISFLCGFTFWSNVLLWADYGVTSCCIAPVWVWEGRGPWDWPETAERSDLILRIWWIPLGWPFGPLELSMGIFMNVISSMRKELCNQSCFLYYKERNVNSCFYF